MQTVRSELFGRSQDRRRRAPFLAFEPSGSLRVDSCLDPVFAGGRLGSCGVSCTWVVPKALYEFIWKRNFLGLDKPLVIR